MSRDRLALPFALGAAAALAAGCQVYDFEPVTPGAVAQSARSVPLAYNSPKPNMMLLVDKSGSMGDRLPSGLTKIQTAQQVMGTFLTDDATVARVGITKFPADTGCTPAGAGQVLSPVPPGSDGDADSVLQAAAQAANTQLQALTPGGATPTAGSLRFFHDNPGAVADASSAHRDAFVLLLTDGLPNCSASVTSSTCTCTDTQSDGCTPVTSCALNSCLDTDVVSTISALQADRGIKTIVIGFGSDIVCGIAPATLESMAEAGGFVRKCPNTSQSCGTGNDCVLATGLCSKQYFQATDGPALAASLAEIGTTLTQETCKYTLVDIPSNPALISVVVNGTPYLTGPNTWVYDASTNQIVFQGTLCDQIKGNTPDNPVHLDIRFLQGL
ncbi:MAG TPA: adventurous gliding motility lipoprotein CglB [Myxococcaceae bacterium]|nr:adventurous gliding motility lipoprotein CglB [Myxococcaceae bacterium]